MFDVESPYTFEAIQSWFEEMSDHIDIRRNFVWAVVGNKCDLDCEIECEVIVEKCRYIGTKLMFFTSAKTGKNVKEMFEAVIREVHRARGMRTAEHIDSGIKLTESSDRSSGKRKCCT